MRTVKPNCLSVLPRCIEHRRELYLCVSTLVMTPLAQAPMLFSEQNLWAALPQAFPDFVEAGLPKQGGEFLLAGAAYAPEGHEQNSIAFGVRFAGIEKVAIAHGRRFTDAQTVVRQEPLARAPLDWTQAYGGPDYPLNPRGCGHPSSVRADGYLPLPTIEAPDHPWHPHPDHNRAMGFGPWDITHPDRLACAGTYDDAWLKTEFPGLATDAQLSIHNVAPLDQRVVKPFSGDEPFELAHLSPHEPILRGTLPAVTVRTFLQREGGEQGLEELSAALRTVVFLPEIDRLVLVWQALCKVSRDDASDVRTLMVAAEHMGRQRSRDHYKQVLQERTDSEDAALLSLLDERLLPQDMPFEGLLSADFDLAAQPAADSFEARLRRRAERQMKEGHDEVVAHGLDPKEHAPPPRFPPPRSMPPLAQLGQYMRELRVEGDQHHAKAQAAADAMRDASEREQIAAGLDFDVVKAELAGAGQGGPPKPAAPETLATLRQLQSRAQAGGQPPSEVDEMLADRSLHERWARQDHDQHAIYMQHGDHMHPAPAASGRFAQRQRRWVQERLSAGQGLAGLDLTGADLRGLDLRSVDCSAAMLEGAVLRGMALDGARFVGAMLARTDLEGAYAPGCDFSDANLGKARLAGLNAQGARFARTNLWQAELTGASFVGAMLVGVQFLHTSLAQCDFSQADLSEAQFVECDLVRVSFEQARLDGAQFVTCQVGGTLWSACQGEDVVFYRFACPGADFSGARLPGARFVDAVDLSGAVFEGAVLTGAYFGQHSVLTQVRMDGVQARQADFSFCQLAGARLQRCDLREASLRMALLEGADLSGANLMQANLSNAVARGARLFDCNLHGADLSRLRLDDKTVIEASPMQRARIYPRWRPTPATMP